MSKVHSSNVARHDAEPTAGQTPAPVWLFVLLGVLGFWGMRHLDGHAGGFHARVYAPFSSALYVESLLPKSDADAMFASGQRLYGTYCSVCHQPTGQGIAGQFPPLAGSDWVMAETPNRMIRLVLDGIQGPMVVKGQSYNNAMPPWRDLLKDEEIAAVLTYVRGNAGWGNAASPVTPEEVATVREKTSGRGTAWAPDELLAVPLSE